jgi:uncharacterized protein YcbX
MEVSEIHRYPLKSGAPEPLNVGNLKIAGLEFDRHWMVVTAQDGRLVSQREKGAQKLSLIRAVVVDGGVELLAPGVAPLRLEANYESGTRRDVTVHGNTYEAIDIGDAAASWISSYLPPVRGQSLRIVHFPSDYVRELNDEFTGNSFHGSPAPSTEFADGYPVLITNEASLADLNGRLESRGQKPVKMNVFRPNIVISGCRPWQEDALDIIRLGTAVLKIVKPCERCPITGVVQEQGAFSSNPNEPRATLKTFHAGRHLAYYFPQLKDDREFLNSPMFGQNAVVIRPGSFNKGESVFVVSQREPIFSKPEGS